MSFAAPWVLLGLGALPALWWLLRVTPPAPRRQRFPAVRLLLGLTAREETPAHTPWWLLALLVGRDLMLALLVLPALRARGYASLPVNFIGKAATFCLLYALPLVLLGAGPWVISPASRVIGWAFAIWGVYLYWWAGIMYYRQSRELVSGIAVRRTD